jgi:hypothetical protein
MQDNIKQVNGVTTLAGAGATGTGSQRVTAAQDTTTVAGSAPGTAGSASANVLTVQGIASMTPVQTTTGNVGCAGQTIANTSITPINVSANTKIITGTSLKKTYICAINLVAGAANDVALVEGTTTTNPCDTSTLGMSGGATAATGWPFTANGGLTEGNGQGVLFVTATAANNVCLFVSTTTSPVVGAVTWTQF